MPDPANAESNPRRFHERLARTIAEAFRLSATSLLNLYPSEVRAIYRLYGVEGSRLEVVLYDSVAGGAGYTCRIGEAGFLYEQLVHGAIERLDCPAQCDSGCRVCLCDYSNQRYWDGFERLVGLEWLRSLLDSAQRGGGPGGFAHWNSPSLAGLAERVSNYQSINIVARTLVGTASYSEESLNQVISWLQAGKKVSLYLFNKLEDRPTVQAPLSVYRRLHPYVLEGALKLFAVPQGFNTDWEDIPRIFVDPELGSPMFKQHFAVQAVTQSLIATPIDVGIVDEHYAKTLKSLMLTAERYDVHVLQEGERMRMWKLSEGKAREFDDIFSVARGAYIKKLSIRDPYCGTRHHTRKLEALLKLIQEMATTLEYVFVRCREVKDKDGHVEFCHDVERRVDRIIQTAGVQKWDVEAVPLKEAGRSFHDREIDITIVSEEGCETTHRYFLTGGIDYLMDTSTETRIFYIRIDK
jgi:hypothetical protein